MLKGLSRCSRAISLARLKIKQAGEVVNLSDRKSKQKKSDPIYVFFLSNSEGKFLPEVLSPTPIWTDDPKDVVRQIERHYPDLDVTYRLPQDSDRDYAIAPSGEGTAQVTEDDNPYNAVALENYLDYLRINEDILSKFTT